MGSPSTSSMGADGQASVLPMMVSLLKIGGLVSMYPRSSMSMLDKCSTSKELVATILQHPFEELASLLESGRVLKEYRSPQKVKSNT